jgi:hypothetical protein
MIDLRKEQLTDELGANCNTFGCSSPSMFAGVCSRTTRQKLFNEDLTAVRLRRHRVLFRGRTLAGVVLMAARYSLE